MLWTLLFRKLRLRHTGLLFRFIIREVPFPLRIFWRTLIKIACIWCHCRHEHKYPPNIPKRKQATSQIIFYDRNAIRFHLLLDETGQRGGGGGGNTANTYSLTHVSYRDCRHISVLLYSRSSANCGAASPSKRMNAVTALNNSHHITLPVPFKRHGSGQSKFIESDLYAVKSDCAPTLWGQTWHLVLAAPCNGYSIRMSTGPAQNQEKPYNKRQSNGRMRKAWRLPSARSETPGRGLRIRTQSDQLPN